MKINEFIRLLSKAGCEIEDHGKKHDRWYSPITGQSDMLPRHVTKDLGKGLEQRLRKTLLGQ